MPGIRHSHLVPGLQIPNMPLPASFVGRSAEPLACCALWQRGNTPRGTHSCMRKDMPILLKETTDIPCLLTVTILYTATHHVQPINTHRIRCRSIGRKSRIWKGPVCGTPEIAEVGHKLCGCALILRKQDIITKR